VKQQRVDGMSFLATFDSPSVSSKRHTQYFEMLGNRAIYHDDWIAGARSGLLAWVYSSSPESMMQQPWELYDLSKDYSEADNLAAKYPEKLEQMKALFDEEAKKNRVYPLNPQFGGRQPRPVGSHFTYYAPTGHLYLSLTPQYENRSHTITALVDIPKDGANGVLIADGGIGGGFSLFLKDGKPTYTYNYFDHWITTIAAPSALPAGRAKILLKFDYDGGGRGKGATVTLNVNDKEVAEGHLPETVPNSFSFEDTFDIGEDTASPVGEYQSPFPFTGTIDRIDLELAPLK
jgi:arylsulfatase